MFVCSTMDVPRLVLDSAGVHTAYVPVLATRVLKLLSSRDEPIIQRSAGRMLWRARGRVDTGVGGVRSRNDGTMYILGGEGLRSTFISPHSHVINRQVRGRVVHQSNI